ncbi:hypothetical protein THIX_10064 [Thiomonas sp. X19]|nr:hypothetical protein THIX_10064 [Thiomonas sp. X19]
MHWALAYSFITLAVSGIVMMFGKFFLLPVLGLSLFGWLSYALKTLHNFVGPLFGIALVIVLLMFIRDNLPNRQDLPGWPRAAACSAAPRCRRRASTLAKKSGSGSVSWPSA